mmetsp:Transcript_4974/g.5868  ORF Transcript_4974/g.5868 Transcript_4974/m.5868 type:complete len:98 (+) Transcript_4974:652-945(+)
MKNPDSDIEDLKKAGVIDFYSVETDHSDFNTKNLEGFSTTAKDKDENIFEIYDRLTKQDTLMRTKTFQKSNIIKYLHPQNEKMRAASYRYSISEEHE